MSYTLIQEEIPRDRHYPFWMLVACILMNRAKGKNAREPLRKLMGFSRHPQDPDDYDFWRLAKHHDIVMEFVTPLGFQKRRAEAIGDLAITWLDHLETADCCELPDGDDIMLTWPGCGQYAADSWAIFVLQRRIDPRDKELRAYIDRTAMG